MIALCYIAPTNLRYPEERSDGFRVVFTDPEGTPEISFYTVGIVGSNREEICRLPKSEFKRYCDCYNLLPDTEYEIIIRSCLAVNGGCSRSLRDKKRAKRTHRLIITSLSLQDQPNSFFFVLAKST